MAITKPSRASKTLLSLKFPRVTKVESFATIIFVCSNAIKAIKAPIPALTALLISKGIVSNKPSSCRSYANKNI